MLGRMLSLVYLIVFSSLNSGIKLYAQSALGFELSSYITAVQYPSIEAKAEGIPHVFGSGKNFSLACSRYAFSIILFQFRSESRQDRIWLREEFPRRLASRNECVTILATSKGVSSRPSA